MYWSTSCWPSSRRQVLGIEHLDLNEVIANLLKMIRRVIGEHITLEFVPGDDLAIVRADRVQIEQIVMNLSVNARDAMPHGGLVTLATENVLIDEESRDSYPWAEPGPHVLLPVIDTGHGMHKQMLEQVSDPFFTTKETEVGTGLGLSTVYGIVKQHKDMIHVYSKIDKGTTFKIYLPRVNAKPGTTEEHRGPVPKGNETILLAEDEEAVRDLAKTILEGAGYTVLTAAGGEGLTIPAILSGSTQFDPEKGSRYSAGVT